jgi:single-stranded DNA-binding protein
MQMLGGKSTGGGSFEVVDDQSAPARASAPARSAAPSRPAPAAAPASFDNFDDDIPF